MAVLSKDPVTILSPKGLLKAIAYTTWLGLGVRVRVRVRVRARA